MITPPPLVDVKPGDPITSQAWNNILQALRTLYDAMNKSLGTLSVAVKDRATGNPLPQALVTVAPTGDTDRPVRVGVYAGGGVKLHLVEQLLAGAYDVMIEAPGFNSETRTITMSQDGGSQALSVEMSATELLSPVPVLFGRALNEALEVATQAGFQIGRIINAHGVEIPPAALPDDAKGAAVLGQVPEPGSLLPKNSPLQLHISAKAEFIERVQVPNLLGLTLEEAKAKLAEAGLVLGSVGQVGK